MSETNHGNLDDLKPDSAVLSGYDSAVHDVVKSKEYVLEFNADDITALSTGDGLREAGHVLPKLPVGYKWRFKKPDISEPSNSVKVGTTGTANATTLQVVDSETPADNLLTLEVDNTDSDNTYVEGTVVEKYIDGGKTLQLNLDSVATGAAGVLNALVVLEAVFKPDADAAWLA